MLDDKLDEMGQSFVELPPLGGAVELDMQCLLHFQDMISDEMISVQSRQKHHFYVVGYRLVFV